MWQDWICASGQMHNIRWATLCAACFFPRKRHGRAAEPTRTSSARQCRRYRERVPLSLYLFFSCDIWVEEAAANPAQTGSILALAGAMTGNSDKCTHYRRRRRCRRSRNAIPDSSQRRRIAFFYTMVTMPRFFFIFQTVCSSDRTTRRQLFFVVHYIMDLRNEERVVSLYVMQDAHLCMRTALSRVPWS